MGRRRRTLKSHPIVAIGLSLSLVIGSLPAPALGEAIEEAAQAATATLGDQTTMGNITEEDCVKEIFAQLAGVPTTGGQTNDEEAMRAALASEPSTTSGIAQAFTHAARERGLDSIEILGNDGTIWNLVKIAGRWRHVDAARAKSADDIRWLLLDDAQFSLLAPESTPWTLPDGSEAPKAESEQNIEEVATPEVSNEGSGDEEPQQSQNEVEEQAAETAEVQVEENAAPTPEKSETASDTPQQADPTSSPSSPSSNSVQEEQKPANAPAHEEQTVADSKEPPSNPSSQKDNTTAKNTADKKAPTAGTLGSGSQPNIATPVTPDSRPERTGLEAMGQKDDNYTIAGKVDYGKAQQVLTLVNKERKAQNLSALHMDRGLEEVAMRRASEIALNFSHGRPDGSSCFSISQQVWAENIAAGISSAEGTMRQWMNSPGHKANILTNGFKSIGVGCFQCGSITYWVQVFGYDAGANSYAGSGVQNKSYKTDISYDVISLKGSGFNLNTAVSNPLQLDSGKTFQLQVGIPNPGWDAVYCSPDGSTFTWKSSNSSVASVSSKGLVKAGTTAGTATITATSPGKKSWSIKVRTTVPISKASVSKIANQYYTGKAIKPRPTVKMGNTTLKEGTHYTLAWSNNVKGGTATVTIKGKGAYTGSKKVTFKIVEPSVQYYVHRQTYGNEKAWSNANGAQSGTTGQSKRLEGIWIRLNQKPVSGSIMYRTHIQRNGWERGWKGEGKMSGTSGQAKRLEAIQIRLTGEMERCYDVYYRVHAQTYGWMGWAKNGQSAGTSGQSKRLEAIQIVILPKYAKAPAANFKQANQSTKAAYIKR